MACGIEGISLCDMCGKRTEKLQGRLVLSTRDGYNNKTVWSQRLCNDCLRKMSNFKSIGDKIREDVETHIDKLYVESKKDISKLLNFTGADGKK